MLFLFCFGLGVGRNGSLFFIHVYSYLYLVLNVAPFLDFGLAIMGLDKVCFTVLDFGWTAVGLDLVSFLSMYFKTNSSPVINFSTTSICPAFKSYLLVSS